MSVIYYVEDDPNIRDLAIYALEQAGLAARGFSNALELYAACENELPRLFLLDIMLPHEDGIQILKHLRAGRATRDIPIMMLTAKGSEYDVVMGLDAGADDYLAKPFGMMELVSRVNALLRRRDRDTEAEDGETLLIDGLTLSPAQRRVTVDGTLVVLTYKEFELLQLLMERPGRVFSRDRLLEAVWGWEHSVSTRTVDVHIQTLRRKLGAAASIIETVRGVGYRAKEASR
ncbi:MAG: response regulator transcription factor [Coriobacteriales bacterium]|jgi:two-component system alkaline phosphatase synthesis response regulator PhoP|nr:response regulator transcription factor [Coriobacteriales bacterium]